MRLIEIILEGFKSHGKRTVLTDLDACFTAISGPNGSGKSNVLDAICFNLGITDLSKVRARPRLAARARRARPPRPFARPGRLSLIHI